MGSFLGANAKAIVALATSILAALALHFGLKLDSATVSLVATGLVTALCVWLVPNTVPPASTSNAVTKPNIPLPPTIPRNERRILFAGAILLAGCGFFTPARVTELEDIACVVEHFELDDPSLSALCKVPLGNLTAAREQAVKSYAASMSRKTSLVRPIADAGADR